MAVETEFGKEQVFRWNRNGRSLLVFRLRGIITGFILEGIVNLSRKDLRHPRRSHDRPGSQCRFPETAGVCGQQDDEHEHKEDREKNPLHEPCQHPDGTVCPRKSRTAPPLFDEQTHEVNGEVDDNKDQQIGHDFAVGEVDKEIFLHRFAIFHPDDVAQKDPCPGKQLAHHPMNDSDHGESEAQDYDCDIEEIHATTLP
jgi:hypothetical protein